MVLKKEKITINDFQIENDILIYEYSKKVYSYFGIILNKNSLLKRIDENIQNRLFDVSLSANIYLNPKKIILFFCVEAKNKKNAFSNLEKIKTIVKPYVEQKLIEILQNEELEEEFFIQIKNFSKLCRKCHLICGNSSFTLLNKTDLAKIEFSKFKFESVDFSNSQIKFLINIVKSLQIDASICLYFSNKRKIYLDLLIKSPNSESILKLNQILNSKENKIPVKTTKMNIKNFLKILKRIPQKGHNTFKIDKVLNMLSRFGIDSHNTKIADENVSIYRRKEVKKKTILETIVKILKFESIQFEQISGEKLDVLQFQSIILIQERLDLKTLSNFLLQNYSINKKLIIVFESTRDPKLLREKTKIIELEEVYLVSKLKLKKELLKIFMKNEIVLFA